MRAARRGDHIGHSHRQEGLKVGAIFGAVAGAGLAVAGAAGLVAGIGATILTGGLAAPLVIAAALTTVTGVGMVLTGGALGASIGEYVGSLSIFGTVTGEIDYGSPDVYINSKQAARVAIDTAPCEKSPRVVALIAMGSSNVFINSYNAARVDDKVSCGAIIIDGSDDVYIGGEQKPFMDVEEEVQGWMHWAVFGAGIAGGLLLFGAAVIPVLGVWGAIEAAIPLFGGGFLGGERGGKLFSAVGRKVGEYLHDELGWNVLPSEFENGGGLLGGLIGGGLGAKYGPKMLNRKYDPNTLGSNGGNSGQPRTPEEEEKWLEGLWKVYGELTNEDMNNCDARGGKGEVPTLFARIKSGPRHGDVIGNAHDAGVLHGKKFLEKLGLKQLDTWVNPREDWGRFGQGIDDVYEKDGYLYIVEYKGGSSDLTPGQMELPWVKKKITEIRDDGYKDMADRLQGALNDGKLRGIAVKTPIEENGVAGDTYILKVWDYSAK